MLLDAGMSSLLFGGCAPFQILGDCYGIGNSNLDRNLQLEWRWAYDGTDACWPTILHKVEELEFLVRLCEDPQCSPLQTRCQSV